MTWRWRAPGQSWNLPAIGRWPNAQCANVENHPKDVPENQLMVGALFTYGRFRFIDLADLDWEKELELVCPINLIGRVSVWQAGRHGALDGAGDLLGGWRRRGLIVPKGAVIPYEDS